MNVKIKLLNDKAVIPYKKHGRDFCYDCVATSCVEVAPNTYEYGLGIALQMDGTEECIPCIDLRAKGGIWKTGMILSNGCGTVDEPYTGEITAVFYHLMPNMPKYEVGDKVCQIRVSFTEEMQFEVVSELEKTERGDGKHGSTGVQHSYTEIECKDKIYSTLVKILLDNKDIDTPESVTKSTRLHFDIGMNSLESTYFLFDVEREFHIQISDKESSTLDTLGDLVNLVYNKTTFKTE